LARLVLICRSRAERVVGSEWIVAAKSQRP
jgi:hypothetical protein